MIVIATRALMTFCIIHTLQLFHTLTGQNMSLQGCFIPLRARNILCAVLIQIPEVRTCPTHVRFLLSWDETDDGMLFGLSGVPGMRQTGRDG